MEVSLRDDNLDPELKLKQLKVEKLQAEYYIAIAERNGGQRSSVNWELYFDTSLIAGNHAFWYNADTIELI